MEKQADQDAVAVRRTQQERTADTRRKLINATIECLVSEGYRNLTIGSIARQAGVSHGAANHHFNTKAELILAATERLIRRAYRRFGETLDQLAGLSDKEKMARIHKLWANSYDADEIVVFMELVLESKRDRELADTIAPIFSVGEKVFREMAEYYFEPTDSNLRLHSIMMMGQWIFRGIEMDSHLFKTREQKSKLVAQTVGLLSHHMRFRPGVAEPPKPSKAWLELIKGQA